MASLVSLVTLKEGYKWVVSYVLLDWELLDYIAYDIFISLTLVKLK